MFRRRRPERDRQENVEFDDADPDAGPATSVAPAGDARDAGPGTDTSAESGAGGGVDPRAATARSGVPGAGTPGAGTPGVGDGPYDVAAAPEDAVARVDLGGLRIPVLEELELRVEMAPDASVAAVTLAGRTGVMQVTAFAAPRSEGLWAEVREEIATALREAGGDCEERPGPFGTELFAHTPTPTPGVLAPSRFIGVDGPRWFLRGLIQGDAARSPAAAEPFERVLRQVVVVRGTDAMIARAPLPLRLPEDISQAAAAAGSPGDDDEGAPGGGEGPGRFDPPTRGPEITETR